MGAEFSASYVYATVYAADNVSIHSSSEAITVSLIVFAHIIGNGVLCFSERAFMPVARGNIIDFTARAL